MIKLNFIEPFGKPVLSTVFLTVNINYQTMSNVCLMYPRGKGAGYISQNKPIIQPTRSSMVSALSLNSQSVLMTSNRNLIDTQGRGSLNNVEFAVGLYLIQAIKTCQLTVLPSSIPPHIYDQLSVKSNSPFATPRSPTKSAPLPWKSPSISVKNVATQFDQPKAEPPWDVSTLEQAEADRHFDTLDTEKSGFVDGDESARFMLKFFRLPASDIAEIWFVLLR